MVTKPPAEGVRVAVYIVLDSEKNELKVPPIAVISSSVKSLVLSLAVKVRVSVESLVTSQSVSYTHLRAHETLRYLV